MFIWRRFETLDEAMKVIEDSREDIRDVINIIYGVKYEGYFIDFSFNRKVILTEDDEVEMYEEWQIEYEWVYTLDSAVERLLDCELNYIFENKG